MSKVEIILVTVTAIATTSAAFSAWFSYCISKNAFEFQKKFTKNITAINLINSAISKILFFDALITKDAYSIPTDRFQTIDSQLFEIKEKLEVLERMGAFDYKSTRLSSINDVAHLAVTLGRDKDFLNNIAQKLTIKLDDLIG